MMGGLAYSGRTSDCKANCVRLNVVSSQICTAQLLSGYSSLKSLCSSYMMVSGIFWQNNCLQPSLPFLVFSKAVNIVSMKHFIQPCLKETKLKQIQ